MAELYLMRHGPTPYNDPEHEALRGWSNVPLAPEAKPLIAETAEKLRGKVGPLVLHSDLERARDTADLVTQDALGRELWPMYGLRPWNSGELAGQPIKVIAPELDYYRTHPGIAPPGGEPFSAFLARWGDTLRRLLSMQATQPILAVTHSRNLYTLHHLLSGGKAPIRVAGPPKPAQAVHLTQTAGGTFRVELL